MNTEKLAEDLKNLTHEEIVKLAKLLKDEKIGLTIGHKPVIHLDTSPIPNTCATGYYYDTETQRCILNVG